MHVLVLAGLVLLAAVAVVGYFTSVAQESIEELAKQSTSRLWTSVFLNAVAVVLVFLEVHEVHTVYAIGVAALWLLPNLRSLHARLTHASRLVEKSGGWLGFFGVRGAAKSMRENPDLYARWRAAGAAWIVSVVVSLFCGGYQFAVRSRSEGPPEAAAADALSRGFSPVVDAVPPPDAARALDEVRLPKGAVLRVGPGSEYKRLRTLKRAETFVVLDRSVPGWVKVEADDVRAWARHRTRSDPP